jgi:hypothetical protein
MWRGGREQSGERRRDSAREDQKGGNREVALGEQHMQAAKNRCKEHTCRSAVVSASLPPSPPPLFTRRDGAGANGREMTPKAAATNVSCPPSATRSVTILVCAVRSTRDGADRRTADRHSVTIHPALADAVSINAHARGGVPCITARSVCKTKSRSK